MYDPNTDDTGKKIHFLYLHFDLYMWFYCFVSGYRNIALLNSVFRDALKCTLLLFTEI